MGSELREYIRDIPDWPVEGIIFRDITPLLGNAEAFKKAIDSICERYNGVEIDYVAAVEARGFIFGSAAAVELGVGFVPIRKKGKLPFETVSVSYDLEYGTDSLEVHKDAFEAGAKVLIVDDLLATGGTMKSACELVEKVGGEVTGVAFLIELADLGGIDKLDGYEVEVIMKL